MLALCVHKNLIKFQILLFILYHDNEYDDDDDDAYETNRSRKIFGLR